jgi:hypothetical protein
VRTEKRGGDDDEEDGGRREGEGDVEAGERARLGDRRLLLAPLARAAG